MSVYKYTDYFNFQSQPKSSKSPIRVGGISQSFLYATLMSIDDPKWKALVTARLALLSSAWSYVGYRIIRIPDPNVLDERSRPVLAGFTNKAGTLGSDADYPSLAYTLFVPSNKPNRLKITLQGLTDGSIQGGESTETVDFGKAVDAYLAALLPFSQRVRDLEAKVVDVATISDVGAVVTRAPFTGVAVGNYVRVLKTQKQFGKGFGGRFRVSAVVDDQHFTLGDWGTIGATKGGKIRFDRATDAQYALPQSTRGKIISKKIGRPFGQFHGRRSNRV